MAEIFKKLTCYPLWEVKNEERDLNIASKNGFQLVEGRAWWWVLEKNDKVRYTYQIDFNPSAKNDPRYKETFAEMGWEYVSSTFNGWHYFKKTYKEGQQTDNGDVVKSECIYTDDESRKEMENRWQKLGAVLYSICFIFGIIYLIESFCLTPGFLGFAFGFFFFGFSTFTSIQNYKKAEENPNFVPKIKIPFTVVLPIFLSLGIISFLCSLI